MTELIDVVAVIAREDYSLDLEFENGVRRRFDATPILGEKPFIRIRDLPVFLKAKVDFGTVVWPGGIDIDPETLWERSSIIE